MSNEHILPTKLAIPANPIQMVPRARLMPPEQAPRIVLVCAPAGYGKTTLISSWAKSCKHAVAWLSVDEGDNDPVRFLMHFVTAIQARFPEFGEISLDMLGCTPPAPVAGLMRSLVIQLCRLPDRLSIILDDLHLIDAAAVHEAIAFLIEHQPPQLQLILASRRDPPFSLARIRGQGKLLEYRAADLRFTLEEAEKFCNDLMCFALPPQQVATLVARTEGWIVGLQLAAVSMREASDKAGFIDSFAGDNRHITDFLLDEVLRSRSPEIQEFLLWTSLLERFNASLCDAVTGRNDSRDMIAELERANMFIVGLDQQRTWYRYHHLFTSLLQHRLQRVSPDIVTKLHLRASRWLSDHGHLAEAVHHALQAQDYELTADLIEQHSHTLLTRGQVKTMLSWAERLPPSVLAARPPLTIACAWSSFYMDDLISLDRYIRIATKLLLGHEHAPVGSKERTMSGQLAIMRGCQFAYSGDLEGARLQLHEALASSPEDKTLYRAAAVGLGVCYFVSGRLDEAQSMMRAYASVAQIRYNALVPITAVFGLARIHLLRGNLLLSRQVYQQAMQECAAAGWQDFPTCGMLHIGLGELAYEMNELASAEQYLRRGIEMTASGMQYINAWARVLLAQVRVAQGVEQDLLDAQDEALMMKHAGRFVVDLPPLSAAVGRLRLMQGRVDALAQWKETAQLDIDRPITAREPEYLVLARCLIDAKQYQQALSLIQKLQMDAQAGKRIRVVVEILILKTVALQAAGDTQAALDCLQQVLNLAEHTNLLRLFIDEGATLCGLLKKLARGTDYTSYAYFLLDQIGAGGASSEAEAAEPLSALFSKKEKAVISEFAKGGSKQEIADALFISYNTVNTHMKSIYAKLGANSRHQAIERLRKLGYLA